MTAPVRLSVNACKTSNECPYIRRAQPGAPAPSGRAAASHRGSAWMASGLPSDRTVTVRAVPNLATVFNALLSSR